MEDKRPFSPFAKLGLFYCNLRAIYFPLSDIAPAMTNDDHWLFQDLIITQSSGLLNSVISMHIALRHVSGTKTCSPSMDIV